MDTSWRFNVLPWVEGSDPRAHLVASLQEWGSKSALARRCNTFPAEVHGWCWGRAVPGPEQAQRIASMLGIPADAWQRAGSVLWARREYPEDGDPRAALSEALGRHGAQAAMARAIGASPMQMSAIVKGAREPTVAQARGLRNELGLPLGWWGLAAAVVRRDAALAGVVVAGHARRELLAWADEWDRQGHPSVCSWHRLGMTEERLVEVLAGAEASAGEIDRAERNARSVAGWWV